MSALSAAGPGAGSASSYPGTGHTTLVVGGLLWPAVAAGGSGVEPCERDPPRAGRAREVDRIVDATLCCLGHAAARPAPLSSSAARAQRSSTVSGGPAQDCGQLRLPGARRVVRAVARWCQLQGGVGGSRPARRAQLSSSRSVLFSGTVAPARVRTRPAPHENRQRPSAPVDDDPRLVESLRTRLRALNHDPVDVGRDVAPSLVESHRAPPGADTGGGRATPETERAERCGPPSTGCWPPERRRSRSAPSAASIGW